MKNSCLKLSFFLGLFSILFLASSLGYSQSQNTTKPFTRWWWMGSAVSKAGIKYNLEEFQKAGLGGVEITPIYGVKGTEKDYLNFLSNEYLSMLDYTCHIGDSLGLQVDMVLGTGWPYGGPQVEPQYAATKLEIDSIQVFKGETFSHNFKSQNANATLLNVLAFGKNTYYQDLSHLTQSSSLEWTAPEDVTIYRVFAGKTGQKVKRAAPGGAGFTVDHYSKEALIDYLKPFDNHLKSNIRAIFNDSYEVYGTDFTPDFFNQFIKRRGYDVKPYLKQLIDKINSPTASRIRSDYRETLSELLKEEFDQTWTKWAHSKGYKTKLQAHGSPGNLLDLYATADIPECETFGSMPFDIPGFRRELDDVRQGDADPMMLKFSSSASHIKGKQLTSSETFTWLRDHFKVSLSQCKPELEELFLNGINHVFLHGSTYSPPEAEWPGWKFYAATNFSPQMTIWNDAPAIFNYIKNCQELLQKGEPDNDIALYWPIYDSWNSYLGGELFFQFKIHSLQDWLLETPFYETGTKLTKAGYGIDFFSDDFLKEATYELGKIKFKGASYKAIIIPPCELIPLETLNKLIELKNSGAKIYFETLPKSAPGYMGKDKSIQLAIEEFSNTPKILDALKRDGILGEEMVETGLKFIKRKDGDNDVYYIVNHLSTDFEGFIPINTNNSNFTIYDPDTEKRGQAFYKKDEKNLVRIQLKAGKSIFIICNKTPILEPKWEYIIEKGQHIDIGGPYNLNFISGGPTLPQNRELKELVSWTSLDQETEYFSGTATYTTTFNRPKLKATDYILRLPEVRESAKIWLNGNYLGTLWSNPFEIKIDNLKKRKNQLKIEVTNLSANRIRAKELMGEEWKIFHEINMVNMDYKPFDAKVWKPTPSGIIGEIQLVPIKSF